MRELNETELEAVSGGATTTEYAILLAQPASDSTADTAATSVLKTRHETAKNAIGNIR